MKHSLYREKSQSFNFTVAKSLHIQGLGQWWCKCDSGEKTPVKLDGGIIELWGCFMWLSYTPAREKYQCTLQRHAIPSGPVICVEEDSFSSRILILNMHGSDCVPGLFDVQGRASNAGLCGFPPQSLRWRKLGKVQKLKEEMVTSQVTDLGYCQRVASPKWQNLHIFTCFCGGVQPCRHFWLYPSLLEMLEIFVSFHIISLLESSSPEKFKVCRADHSSSLILLTWDCFEPC